MNSHNVKSDSELITDLISFPRGRQETVLRLLKQLTIVIGDVLFYCDSGQMAIVNKGKSIEEIMYLRSAVESSDKSLGYLPGSAFSFRT